MDFEERARKAHDRGQLVRAAVLLAEGLKRDPHRLDALDFLTNLFANELQSPGLENDLLDALDSQDDLRERVEFILERYAERDRMAMGRELARAANERHGSFEWPPPTPEPDIDVSPEPELPAQSVGDQSERKAADVAHSGVVTDPAREASVEAQTDAEQNLEQEDLPKADRDIAQSSSETDDLRDESDLPPSAPQDIAADDDSSEDFDDVSAVVRTETDEEDAAANDSGAGDEPPPNRSSRLRVVASLAGLLVLGGAVALWVFVDSDEAEVDVASESVEMETLDTAIPQTRDDSTRAGAQQQFVDAVYAVDWGMDLDEAADESGRWSTAQRAVVRAQRGDFEQAIADVTRLEQRFPADVATLWTRAFLEEARGRYSQSLERYSEGQRRYPEFVPFQTGEIRIQTRQGGISEHEAIFRKLDDVSPEHPYLRLEQVQWPTRAYLFEGRTQTSGDGDDVAVNVEDAPRIVRAALLVDSALSIESSEERISRVRSASRLEPHIVSTQTLLGVLEAESMNLDDAEDAFEAAASVDGSARSTRWLNQTAAQYALSAAGRPDRAIRFAIPFDLRGDDADSDHTALVPESIVEPMPAQDVLDSARAVESVGMRSLLLGELGMFATAHHLLEAATVAVESPAFVHFVEVQLHILHGRRNDAERTHRRMADGPYKQLSRAAISLHLGDYAAALKAAEASAGQGGPPHLAAKYAALSLASDGQVRQALARLERWRVGTAVANEHRALRMRVLARVDPEAPSVVRAYDLFNENKPTDVTRRIDLAETDFWRKDFDAAAAHLKAAAEHAPDHPEVNWLLSLVARSSSSVEGFEDYADASWRSRTGDVSLLLELGRIQLDLERYAEARQLFYRALLADRTSVEAIRGMGRAYLEYDPKRGRRDMAGISENYGGDSASLAPRAEVYRWLAVLHGVRDGSERGYAFLEQAVELIGETPPLLVEKARYLEASDRPAEARRTFARAIERNSSYASAHLGLARSALDAGDSEVAQTHLERYLDLGGRGKEARWARETLAELKGATSPDRAE